LGAFEVIYPEDKQLNIESDLFSEPKTLSRKTSKNRLLSPITSECGSILSGSVLSKRLLSPEEKRTKSREKSKEIKVSFVDRL
jgi:hypothetical protein